METTHTIGQHRRALPIIRLFRLFNNIPKLLFLLTQEVVFSGNTYWLVQATYLLIGIDVLALAQIMNTHYKRLKLIASKR